jgi:hypothetical protein
MGSNAYYPEDQPAMLVEDYERLKAQSKRDAEAERIRKAHEDEIKRELHKEQIKIKDKINYTEELAQEICERIAAGELLINICKDEHMPTVRRCNVWLKQNDDFQILYRDSLNDRLSIFEEQVISIADDAAHDFKEVIRNGKATRQIDAEVIARAKLRVEVRFRHLKAGRPGKWGDTSTLITKTEDEQIIDSMSTDELEKKIADLEEKDNIIKVV